LGEQRTEALSALCQTVLWGLAAELPLQGSMTNMETVQIKANRSFALPLFLTGLGSGVALALLFAPLNGAATRSLIGRKIEDGEDWVKGKAAAAEDYVLTQGVGLRDYVRKVSKAIGRS
jgi:hypothetical protein